MGDPEGPEEILREEGESAWTVRNVEHVYRVRPTCARLALADFHLFKIY